MKKKAVEPLDERECTVKAVEPVEVKECTNRSKKGPALPHSRIPTLIDRSTSVLITLVQYAKLSIGSQSEYSPSTYTLKGPIVCTDKNKPCNQSRSSINSNVLKTVCENVDWLESYATTGDKDGHANILNIYIPTYYQCNIKRITEILILCT